MVVPLKEVQKIVKGLSSRELKNPEGAGVDLRIGSVHKISEGEAFINADTETKLGLRSGFETELLVEYLPDAEEQRKFIFLPGEYYLVKTIEVLETPLDVMGDFRPRSTLFRSGLNLLTTLGTPGYNGELIFGLTNIGPFPVTLQMGARICSAVFYRLEEEGVGYKGQNQGGRVTASGVEEQI